MQDDTASGRSFDWPAYCKPLAALGALAKSAPVPEMQAERDRLEALLLPEAPFIPHDGQRATVLEDAIQVGAARLVHALQPVGTKDLAKLNPGQWMHFVIRHSEPDLVRAAMDRDLSLEGILNAIWPRAIHDPKWRGFLLEEVSRDRWWMPYPGTISRWFFDRSNAELASSFMRAQTTHHPERAANAMQLSGDHLHPFHEQVMLRRAGVAMPAGMKDRLNQVLEEEPSNHARMKTLEAYTSLETMHRHYNSFREAT